MGRHSSTSQFHYYRSIVAWFLPWALVASVVGIGVWVGVDVLGGDEIRDPSTPVVAASSPDDEDELVSPSPVQSATPEPVESKEPDDAPTKEPQRKLITEGITVQVLNATTGDPDADDLMADRLAKLGFDVIAVGGANRVYQRTTVLWSFDEAKDAAERLAERFGYEVGPKPANLSTTVDLHVIVGEDFSG